MRISCVSHFDHAFLMRIKRFTCVSHFDHAFAANFPPMGDPDQDEHPDETDPECGALSAGGPVEGRQSVRTHPPALDFT